MWTTAREMFHKGGVRPFFVGAAATVSRDLAFGGVFAFLRYYIHYKMAENDDRDKKRQQRTHTSQHDPRNDSCSSGGSCNNTASSGTSTNSGSSISSSSSYSSGTSNTASKDKGIRTVYVQFLVSMVSACSATILSSPFNYVRNMHYACPPDVSNKRSELLYMYICM